MIKTRLEKPFLSVILKITNNDIIIGDLINDTIIKNEFYKATKEFVGITIPDKFHNILLGFPTEHKNEMIEWMRDNSSDVVWYCQYRIWFKTQEEAIMFKLRWC